MRRPKDMRTALKASVGIFYLVGIKIWIEATPIERASSFGQFRIRERDHIFYWEELVSSRLVSPGEYDEHPRGRVAYITNTRKFLFLADACILRDQAFVETTLRQTAVVLAKHGNQDPPRATSAFSVGSSKSSRNSQAVAMASREKAAR